MCAWSILEGAACVWLTRCSVSPVTREGLEPFVERADRRRFMACAVEHDLGRMVCSWLLKTHLIMYDMFTSPFYLMFKMHAYFELPVGLVYHTQHPLTLIVLTIFGLMWFLDPHYGVMFPIIHVQRSQLLILIIIPNVVCVSPSAHSLITFLYDCSSHPRTNSWTL